MTREFSAGGIIFNKKGQVLLIQNSSMKDHGINYWGFPKGHIDPGESSENAATREVREETGLEVEIVSKVGDSKYVYTSAEKGKIFKIVIIYLMIYQGGEISIQQEELLDAGWFSPEEAFKKLSFSNDKKLLQKALDILENQTPYVKSTGD